MRERVEKRGRECECVCESVRGVVRVGEWCLGAGCWMLDARKKDSLGGIGKYKYYRTLRRARERQ